jgi:hypothetical protein
VKTEMTTMNRLTLMLIVGAALPVAVIAQTTTQTVPPSDPATNTTTADPSAATPSDVTTNSTAPTDGSVTNTTSSTAEPKDGKTARKNKKPMGATE